MRTEGILPHTDDRPDPAVVLRGRKRKSTLPEHNLPNLPDAERVVQMSSSESDIQLKERIPTALIEAGKKFSDEEVQVIHEQLKGIRFTEPVQLIRAVLAIRDQQSLAGLANQDIPVVHANEEEIPEVLKTLGREVSEENIEEMRRFYNTINKLIEKPFETANLSKEFKEFEGGREAAQFLIRSYVLDFAKQLLGQEEDELKRKQRLEGFVSSLRMWTANSSSQSTRVWERGSLYSLTNLDDSQKEHQQAITGRLNGPRNTRSEDGEHLVRPDVLAAKWLRDILTMRIEVNGWNDSKFNIILSEALLEEKGDKRLEEFVLETRNSEIRDGVQKRVEEKTREKIKQRIAILSFVRGYLQGKQLSDWSASQLRKFDQILEKQRLLVGPEGSYQDTSRGKEVKALNQKSQEMFALGKEWEKPFIARQEREAERQRALEQEKQEQRDRQQVEQIRLQLTQQREQALGEFKKKFLDAARTYKTNAQAVTAYESSLRTQNQNGGIFQQLKLFFNRSQIKANRERLNADQSEGWAAVLAVQKEMMDWLRSQSGNEQMTEEEMIESFNILLSSVQEEHRQHGAQSGQLEQMTAAQIEHTKSQQLRDAITLLLPSE